jgi:hypothetical protein
VESDVSGFKAQLGWNDFDFDVIRWRNEVHKKSPAWLRGSGDQLIWALAEGDVSRLEQIRKMDITDALKILVLKEVEAFKMWYQINKK